MRISDWSSDVCSSDLWSICVSTARTGLTLPTHSSVWARCGCVGCGLRRNASTIHTPHSLNSDRDSSVNSLKSVEYHAERDRQANRIPADRKSVVYGKSVSVRVDLGCRRSLKKKKIT